MAEPPASFYDIVERDINGEELKFDVFKGKVVYGLNVASRCAFSPTEYRQLKEVGERYQGGDFSVVAFPSAQFANQECENNADIIAYAREHGPKNLIVMEKAPIKGKAARPVYRWLAANAASPVDTKWNFRGKFVVSKTGAAYGAPDPVPLIERFLSEAYP
eukprot:TRINITY_DN34347_c0_g1_i1.p1 TRINITY_DN34347_c0_g1~~TRINITY_DN34347_c0_g1_i1.p1  ORF type:complete len:161 (+),score=32.56 TRINITY_DN34347_c0_g1_i1:33-515(+)